MLRAQIATSQAEKRQVFATEDQPESRANSVHLRCDEPGLPAER